MKKIILLISVFLFVFTSSIVARSRYTCTSGNCKNGYGTALFKNDTVYKGHFKKSKFHGKGVIFYSNIKRKGKGIWKKGKLWKGYGVIVMDNGSVYMGNIKKGKFHGKGIFVMRNGNYYKGFFRKGKFTGCGSFYNKSDTLLVSGCWEHGKFVKE